MTTLEQLDAGPTRDRYGRYLIPPPGAKKPVAHTRATTVAEVLDDRHNLELWLQRQVALGLAARPDLLAQAAAHTADDKAVLNKVCKDARDAAAAGAAANTGTALHRILERVDTGEVAPDAVPPMFADTVAAYRATLDAAGVEVDPLWCERTHVLDGLAEPIAGMADNHVTIDGRRFIADKKTGSGIDYGAGGFAVQLAIYAHATSVYDWASRSHVDMPAVDQERALIIHVPAQGGDITLHWLDIAAGWEALERALWARQWRKRKGLLMPFEAPTPAAPTKPRRGNAVALPKPEARPRPDEGGAADATKVARLRADFNALDDASSALLSRWVKEGTEASVPWNLGDNAHTLRRLALGRTALNLLANTDLVDPSEPDDADEAVRLVLAQVLGDEALQPALSVGGLIGGLTIDEARQVNRLAKTARLSTGADGAVTLVAA